MKKMPKEDLKMAEIIVTERKDTEDYSSLRVAAVDENGNAMSKGAFKYMDSSYGKGWIRTMIAGGIGTPVHLRRGGNVRKMFERMHTEAVGEGAAVALLHPFSFAYYRKFGYEKVSDHLIVKCPTRYIDFVPRECNFVPYDEGMLPDVMKIYNTFAMGRNLLFRRFDDRYYNKPDRHIYVYYKKGEPAAFIMYSASKSFVVNHSEDGVLTVHELAYTSPDALREIFSFLRMFEGEYDDIEFANIAMCPEVELMLRHYTHTSYTLVPDVMAKVLNTEKLLLANDYPTVEGEFTVKVEDTMDSVCGTFKVAYGGGDCSVKRVDGGADLTLSASAFARLAYGYDGANAEMAKYMDGVQIDGDAEDFFRAFPKKPCGIFEHF